MSQRVHRPLTPDPLTEPNERREGSLVRNVLQAAPHASAHPLHKDTHGVNRVQWCGISAPGSEIRLSDGRTRCDH